MPLSLFMKLVGLRIPVPTSGASSDPFWTQSQSSPGHDFSAAQAKIDAFLCEVQVASEEYSTLKWSEETLPPSVICAWESDHFMIEAPTPLNEKEHAAESWDYELPPPPYPSDSSSLDPSMLTGLDTSVTLCGSSMLLDEPDIDPDFDLEDLGHWNDSKKAKPAPFFDLQAQLRDFQPDFSKEKPTPMMDPMFYNEERDEIISEAEYARRRKAAKAMGTTYGPPSPCPSPIGGRSPRKPRNPRGRRSKGRKSSGPTLAETTAQLDALLSSMAKKDPLLI
jgi:hypothetical protein